MPASWPSRTGTTPATYCGSIRTSNRTVRQVGERENVGGSLRVLALLFAHAAWYAKGLAEALYYPAHAHARIVSALTSSRTSDRLRQLFAPRCTWPPRILL